MMMVDNNDGQMIFRDLGGLKLPDICLTGEENPRKNLTQETCPDRGSNPGPLRDRRACYRLSLSGGRSSLNSPGEPFMLRSVIFMREQEKINVVLYVSYAARCLYNTWIHINQRHLREPISTAGVLCIDLR